MSWEIRQGDCRELLAEVETGSVGMVFCDPPYGLGFNDAGGLTQRGECAFGNGLAYKWEWVFNGGAPPTPKDARPILNDNPAWFNDALPPIFAELSRVLEPGGCCCCCGGGGGPKPIFAEMTLMLDQTPGLEFKQAVVWDKGGLGMGIHYRRNYEFVLVAQRKGAACKWYDTSHKIANVLRLPKIIPSAEQHPTAKPPGLAAWFIRLHSLPGDLVLDCFMGGGSTGEAAVNLNRDFLGFELDPGYCDLARRRLAGAQEPLLTV